MLLATTSSSRCSAICRDSPIRSGVFHRSCSPADASARTPMRPPRRLRRALSQAAARQVSLQGACQTENDVKSISLEESAGAARPANSVLRNHATRQNFPPCGGLGNNPLTIRNLTLPPRATSAARRRFAAADRAPTDGAQAMASKPKKAEAEDDADAEAEDGAEAAHRQRAGSRARLIMIAAAGAAGPDRRRRRRPISCSSGTEGGASRPPRRRSPRSSSTCRRCWSICRPPAASARNISRSRSCSNCPTRRCTPQIQTTMPRVMDAFQTYLRELRPTDLDGSAGLYRLKEELTRRVNAAIAPSRINAVLFKEIVVQ